MPLLQTLQTTISSVPLVEQFFLNPLGLLGILALLPLAIFYLVKPKPEEQVMPSMRFFHEEEGSSQLRSAFRTILRNVALILQVLAVVAFTAALANPFITALEQPENSVIILDRSASMNGDFSEAKDFVEEQLGEKNTLILADTEIEVKAEKAPPSKIKSILERIKPVETETDIASAIDTAKTHKGRLVIASDLDQTVDSRDISQLLTSQSTRPVETIQIDKANKWGITGLEIGENSTRVEVSSFSEEKETLRITKSGSAKKVVLEAEETASVRFSNQNGKNTVTLPEDGMSADNAAYYIVPESRERTVKYLGQENQYFRTAVELASGIILAGNSTSPDIYVLNSGVQQSRLDEVASQVENGASAVIFKDSRALKTAFGFKTSYTRKNSSVSLNYPQRIDIGETEVLDRGISTGKSLSNPENAFKIHSYGEGKILAYNIDDSDFRYSFMYPVFWKSALLRISDTPTKDELNRQTGRTLETESIESPSGKRYSGEVELNETGFYSSGDTVYAANLLSEDESSPDGEEYSAANERNLAQKPESVQSLAVLLLVALIATELAYLWYRGDL